MAHFLQGLVIAVLFAASARAQGFSHALHLKLKLECRTCHVKAASSRTLNDSLLPAPTVCALCHQDDRKVGAARPVRLRAFNHELHVKLGNMAPVFLAAVANKTYLADPGPAVAHWKSATSACTACHRGTPISAKAQYPHMADCLVCHNRIDPPFSCEKCHAGDQNLKPASHTPDYLDTHTKRGEKVGCAVCHGRRFTCLGCH